MLGAKNRSNHTKPWHADDIEQMAELIFAGRTIPEMANILGRSQEAVRAKANDLDFLPKRTRRKSVSAQDAMTDPSQEQMTHVGSPSQSPFNF